MNVDLATFRSRFPEFAGKADGEIEAAIEEAILIHDVQPIATLYCAAHLVALNSEHTGLPDGGSGVVSSESIGPRSIGYMTQAGQSARRAFYATSSYGRRFLEIEARTPRAGIGARVA